MAEQNFTIARDLSEARAMAQSLIPYVYEEQLYSKVGGGGVFSGGKMPALTIGALLLRLRRLHALRGQMSDSQRVALEAVEAEHKSVQKEWRVHYDGKLIREALSRLNSLEPYFEECKESMSLCANAYFPEALRRTIVQEIVIVMDDLLIESDAVRKKVKAADSKLQRWVEPTPFIWAEMLQSVYPKADFWWLYQRPPFPEKI
jgi:hypothetical protein